MTLICVTLHRGTLPVDEAVARAAELRDAAGSAYVRASALGALGLLRAMRGEFDEARALVAEVGLALEELGLRQAAAAHSIAVSEVETLAGDDAAAEQILRAGLAAVTALGDEHAAVHVAWRLALALARQGRYDEAEPFVLTAQRAEHPALWVDVWWRVVLALIEAHRGREARVRELVEDARGRMAQVDESGMEADALLESAAALRAVGLDEEAAPLVAEAARIAARLGYVVAQRRAEEAQRAPTA
jgi:tetratricopeptide (TPR) repeat protein